jgi:hypothetical protein
MAGANFSLVPNLTAGMWLGWTLLGLLGIPSYNPKHNF